MIRGKLPPKNFSHGDVVIPWNKVNCKNFYSNFWSIAILKCWLLISPSPYAGYEDDLGDVISLELIRLSSVALTDMMILVIGTYLELGVSIRAVVFSSDCISVTEELWNILKAWLHSKSIKTAALDGTQASAIFKVLEVISVHSVFRMSGIEYVSIFWILLESSLRLKLKGMWFCFPLVKDNLSLCYKVATIYSLILSYVLLW